MADKNHITETPDTSHIKNIDVTHEVSDVYIQGIAKFVAALAALMLVSFFLMWVFFRSLESKTVEPPPPPLAVTETQRLPPEPRLQAAPGFAERLDKSAPGRENQAEIKSSANTPKNPTWEIQVLRDQWNDVLAHGPIDQNGQRYGMPIEQAKQEVLKQLAAKQEGRTQ